MLYDSFHKRFRLKSKFSWVRERACYTPSLIVKIPEEGCSYVVACRIVIPSLLHHTVGDVLGEVGQEKTPGFAFINLRVLCVLPLAQVQRDMQRIVRKPDPNHFCGAVIAFGLWCDREFAFHDT